MLSEKNPDALAARYRETRARTIDLTATLSAEDMQVQSMLDASPTKWHLGHTTWFFETFVLESQPGFAPVDARYRVIFNSYYEQVGDKHPRPQRGMLTRPALQAVLDYRRRVDDTIQALLDQGDVSVEARTMVELGLNHEEQHQELLLMDIKHVLGRSPLEPAFRPETPPTPQEAPDQKWHRFPGGTVGTGHASDGFAFDNERPRHMQIVGEFELAHRLVTNREWLQFINDGGYQDPCLWLSDGWEWRQENEIIAPSGWRDLHGWTQYTLHGREELRMDDPVTHLSYYEADAFARWSDARLPTEGEWEAMAEGQPAEGHFLTGTSWHPRPATAMATASEAPDAPVQLFGDAWEWTQSAYSAYPGYRPARGAVGEYNGKFMANQFVLRGGSFATATGHVRASYRNFFHPHTRWHFSGLRLARDV